MFISLYYNEGKHYFMIKKALYHYYENFIL